MSSVKVRLTGCDRYNFKGNLYEKGKVYMISEVKAKIMLRKQDEFDRPYFTVYVAPEKSKEQRIAEEAAKALAAATAKIEAEEENLVEIEDVEEVEDDVPVESEEVDTDDDPDLDEDTPANPEELLVEEDSEDEDKDRDDGTAVEV